MQLGKNTKKLLMIFKIKRMIFPLIYFLDKISLLRLITPLLNRGLAFYKIDKRYNKELEYRTLAKLFRKSFARHSNSNNDILFIAAHGVNTQINFVEMMLAKKFNDEKNYPSFLVCDGIIPMCDRERIFRTRNETFLFCKECFNGYKKIESDTGLSLKYLSGLVTSDINTTLGLLNIELEKLNTLEDCKIFKFNNHPFGQITLNSIYRHFNKGNLDNTKEIVDVYKLRIYSVAKYFLLLNEYRKKYGSPKIVIIWNGVLSIGAVTRYWAEINSIKYITLENYVYKKNSFIYKKNGVAVHYRWDEDWEKEKNSFEFIKEKKNKSELFIKNILEGVSFGQKYNDANKLILNKNERYVGLFTNLNFDTYVVGRNPVFNSMNEWLVKTIEYWNKEVENIKLIVRPHPAEEKILIPVLEYVRDLVNPLLSDKIIFIDSNQVVSSYYLLENIEYGLVYSSTIGFEMALRDITCMASGETYYDKFIIKPTDVSDYFKKIEDLNSKKLTFKYDQEELKKFIYFFYYEKVYQWNGINFDGTIEFLDANLESILQKNKKLLDDFYKYSL